MAWNALSIKWKVILGITATSTLAIASASLVFAWLEVGRLATTIEREAVTLARVVASSSVGPLAFADVDAARDLVATLDVSERVSGAVLYGPQGSAFVWYLRSSGNATGVAETLPGGLPARRPADGVTRGDGAIRISQPIVSDGEALGALTLFIAGPSVAEAVSAIARTVPVILVSLLIALALAWVVQAAITGPISEIVAAMRAIAEGNSDLTQRLRDDGRDELGELARSFNAFVSRIHDTMARLSDTARQLEETSTYSCETSRSASEGAASQQSEISQVAAALNQMATTVQEVASNVDLAANDATNADEESNQGKAVVKETMEAIRALADDIGRASDVIERLQKDSENIGSVLDVIRGIAEQTNLLALNAAIEAARAGEQGRGFAVVADEVRTLASRTQSSTEEIHGMIERLQQGSREAVTVMAEGRKQADSSVAKAEQASSSLGEITRAVNGIRNMTSQIATASREQSQVTEEINQRIANISQVSNNTASGALENTARSEDIMRLSRDLTTLMQQYRT